MPGGSHLFGFGQRGGDLSGDFGQLVHDALHDCGVAKVLEGVTPQFENLARWSMADSARQNVGEIVFCVAGESAAPGPGLASKCVKLYCRTRLGWEIANAREREQVTFGRGCSSVKKNSKVFVARTRGLCADQLQADWANQSVKPQNLV